MKKITIYEITPEMTLKAKVIYDFKNGKSMEELATENNLELLEVEAIIRRYMLGTSQGFWSK